MRFLVQIARHTEHGGREGADAYTVTADNWADARDKALDEARRHADTVHRMGGPEVTLAFEDVRQLPSDEAGLLNDAAGDALIRRARRQR